MNALTHKHNFSAKQIISELYSGSLITLLSISFWSIFVLYLKPLYRWSIALFHIEMISGYPKSKLTENYNALIDYYLPWVKGDLFLPSLPQSAHGIQHFAEVKDIFNMLLLVIPVTALLLIWYVWSTHKQGNFHYLKTASIMLVIVPFILSSGFLINFTETFTLFHRLFFNNNYWQFNAATDPIILMLPEEFFMLCAIFIILFQFLMSLLCFLLYKALKSKKLVKI